jgi:HEAT repeat protein
MPQKSDSAMQLIEILQGPEEPEGPNQAAHRRPAAADALGSLGDPVAVPALVEALKDKNYVSVCAAAALAKIRDPRAVEPLIAVLQDQEKFWVPLATLEKWRQLRFPPFTRPWNTIAPVQGRNGTCAPGKQSLTPLLISWMEKQRVRLRAKVADTRCGEFIDMPDVVSCRLFTSARARTIMSADNAPYGSSCR